MKNKIISLLLAMTLIIGITGCANSPDEKKDATKVTNASSVTVKDTQANDADASQTGLDTETGTNSYLGSANVIKYLFNLKHIDFDICVDEDLFTVAIAEMEDLRNPFREMKKAYNDLYIQYYEGDEYVTGARFLSGVYNVTDEETAREKLLAGLYLDEEDGDADFYSFNNNGHNSYGVVFYNTNLECYYMGALIDVGNVEYDAREDYILLNCVYNKGIEGAKISFDNYRDVVEYYVSMIQNERAIIPLDKYSITAKDQAIIDLGIENDEIALFENFRAYKLSAEFPFRTETPAIAHPERKKLNYVVDGRAIISASYYEALYKVGDVEGIKAYYEDANSSNFTSFEYANKTCYFGNTSPDYYTGNAGCIVIFQDLGQDVYLLIMIHIKDDDSIPADYLTMEGLIDRFCIKDIEGRELPVKKMEFYN